MRLEIETVGVPRFARTRPGRLVGGDRRAPRAALSWPSGVGRSRPMRAFLDRVPNSTPPDACDEQV
jgi:hypothetical protein